MQIEDAIGRDAAADALVQLPASTDNSVFASAAGALSEQQSPLPPVVMDAAALERGDGAAVAAPREQPSVTLEGRLFKRRRRDTFGLWRCHPAGIQTAAYHSNFMRPLRLRFTLAMG